MKILQKIDQEIIHFFEGNTFISSKGRLITYKTNNASRKIIMPSDGLLKNTLSVARKARRALRLDKCNVFFHKNNLVIIRQGKVFFYDFEKDELTKTLELRNCRNVLHQSINTTPEGYIFFGEYGNNGNRENVPVYRSIDGGRSWEEIYTFPPNSIKHIHGCYYDKYTNKIWVCTGDFEGENWMLVADKDFKDTKMIGNGKQQYRAVNIIFTEKEVHWLMDSQLEPSHHIIFNRETETINIAQKMMGPIWYIKALEDGYYLAGSAQEIGPGVLDDKVHLYVSNDLKEWKTLKTFSHDKLPKRYFKFGVIGFADGKQSSKEFYMFFEAVTGLDGKSLKCSLL